MYILYLYTEPCTILVISAKPSVHGTQSSYIFSYFVSHLHTCSKLVYTIKKKKKKKNYKASNFVRVYMNACTTNMHFVCMEQYSYSYFVQCHAYMNACHLTINMHFVCMHKLACGSINVCIIPDL